MNFKGFTHLPVDPDAVLGGFSECSIYPALTPFFNYLNTNHAEGLKKWYISACPDLPVKVYLPATAILYQWDIRDSEATEDYYNGKTVLVNIAASFGVSSDITVIYQHITLLEEIKASVQESPNGYVIVEAGTRIGYMYTPDLDINGLDFGVSDNGRDSGLTRNAEHWWNSRVNPMDYFTDRNRESILKAYQGTYDALVVGGVTPYSNLEDSRANLREKGKIWGGWFKDDLLDAFGGDQKSYWATATIVKKSDLHHETYWKTLQEFPLMSGLFVETSGREVVDGSLLVGNALYEGLPIGVSKFYILSGNDEAGVARIERDYGDNPRGVYLKYEFQQVSASEFDDKLIMESFPTSEEALAGQFSGKAVIFRKDPCHESNPVQNC